MCEKSSIGDLEIYILDSLNYLDIPVWMNGLSQYDGTIKMSVLISKYVCGNSSKNNEPDPIND